MSGHASSPGSSSRLRRWLARDLGLFSVALAVRLLLTAVYSSRHTTVSGLELGTLADNLLAGRGFMWEFYGSDVARYSFFPPFYPAFLAFLKLVFGAGWIPAMQIVQALASAATPVVVRRLAAHLGTGPRVAIAAGFAVAFWPPLVIYSAAAYSLTFEALAVPAIVLLLVVAGKSGRPADAARAGAVYGLLAYALPAFLGSLLFVPLGFRAMGVPGKRANQQAAIALLVALAVISPWTVRNALIHHRFVPMATNIGFNYLGGQNPHSRPHINVLCPFDEIRWSVIDRRALETMNEVDFDRMLLRQGLSFAVREPWLTARRSAVRLLYYWWGSPDVIRYSPTQGIANLALMTLVMPFFLIGLVHAVRDRRRFGLVLAVLAWQSLFYMNFAIRGRYAMTSHSLLVLVAVVGASLALARVRAWREPKARQPAFGRER